MDAVDVRILRTMGVQAYGRTPRDPALLRSPGIARALRLSPETVKERVRRMERAGVIGGYEVHPNFRHLGLEASCYFVRFPGGEHTKEASALRDVDGVVAVYQFLGGLMCLMLWYRSPADLERKLRLVTGLVGDAEFEKFLDLDMPPVQRPLSSLDWRLLQALRGDALRSPGEVAKALKVNPRTVKRRLDRMAREGSFFITPRLDPSKAEGMLLFMLGLHLDPEAGPQTIPAVHRAFDAHLLSVDVPVSHKAFHYSLFLAAHSPREVRELQRRAAAVKGVRKATPLLFEDAFESFAWLDEALAAKVREAGGGRAG